VITAEELPLEYVLEIEIKSWDIFCLLQLLDYLSNNLEEVHSCLVFKICSFTFDIIHVVSDFVLVATESSTKPVETIF